MTNNVNVAGRQVLTFKTRIYLDDFTKQYCERAFGVRRFVWNWALNEHLVHQAELRTKTVENRFYLQKKFREAVRRKNDKSFEWLANQMVSSKVMEEVLKDLEDCFAQCKDVQKDVNKNHKKNKSNPRFSRNQRKWHKVQPRFKKRKQLASQSFRYYCALDRVFRIEDNKSVSWSATDRKQRCVGKTRESLAFLREDGVKLCTFTIKREADKYWICISYEKPNRTVTTPTSGKIGIDLGVKISACTFDGSSVQNVSFNTKHSRHLERMSKRLDESLSRKEHGSSRYTRELLLKQKREAKAARIRHDELEKFTTFVAENYADVVVDDFSFKGSLAVANCDEAYRCMIYQTKLRLQQKLEERGLSVRYVEHGAGQRTTCRCSQCGGYDVAIDESKRTFHCRACGHRDDRDANAAKCTQKFY